MVRQLKGATRDQRWIFFSLKFSTFICSHFSPTYADIFSNFPTYAHILSYLLIISWYIPESKGCEMPLKRWTPTRTAMSLSASSSSWWPSDYLTFTCIISSWWWPSDHCTFTFTLTFNILNKWHHIKQLMTKWPSLFHSHFNFFVHLASHQAADDFHQHFHSHFLLSLLSKWIHLFMAHCYCLYILGEWKTYLSQ